MRVALGEAPPDLLVTGGTVLNVYTEEWLRADVAVADQRVAAVRPDLAGLAGPDTERVDAAGRVVVPASSTAIRTPTSWSRCRSCSGRRSRAGSRR